jgi:hypothetical protein
VTIVDNARKTIAVKEAALFIGFLFVGVALLPIGIYLVGQQVFGQYAGSGYGDFLGELLSGVVAGQIVAWFLVLSPYVVWQLCRLTIFGWRSRPVTDD